MRIAAQLLCIGIWLAGQVALAGEEDARTTKPAAVDNFGQRIKSIVTSWKMRRQQLSAGETEWRLQRQLRAGDYPAIAGRVANGTRRTDSVRASFSPERIRLEGICAPAIQFGRGTLADNAGWAAAASGRQFEIALTEEFTEQKVRALLLRPYVVTIDRQSETHFWKNAARETPCVVLSPAGSAGPLRCFDGTKAACVPWMWGLIEGLRLSLRPDWVCESPGLESKARVLLVRPMIGDRRGLMLELPLESTTDGCIVQLLIDPARDNLVVRATFRGGKERSLITQYDVAYDRDEQGLWFPERISLVQFNGYGDPYDELLIIRENVRRSPASVPEIPAIKIPPGALVVDQIAGDQYRIAADGSRQPQPFAETVAEMNAVPALKQQESGLSRLNNLLQSIVYGLISWPGILSLIVAFFVGRSVLTSAAKRRSGTVGPGLSSHQMDQQSSSKSENSHTEA